MSVELCWRASGYECAVKNDPTTDGGGDFTDGIHVNAASFLRRCQKRVFFFFFFFFFFLGGNRVHP